MWIILALFILLGIYLIWHSLVNSESKALNLLSALSTYAVVLVTIVYAITTSEQRDVMASQLNEMHNQHEVMADQLEEIRRDRKIQRLSKEMDFIVGPLKSKIGHFKAFEPLFLEEDNEQRSISFWEDIKRNLYLTSDDLHSNIEKYLAAFEEQKRELGKVRYEIKEKADTYGKGKKIPEWTLPRYRDLFNPAPINEGYNSYLKSIENYNKEIGYDSDYGKSRSWFFSLASEFHKYDIRVNGNSDKVSIHDAREDLEHVVQRRYNALKIELSKSMGETGEIKRLESLTPS